MTTVAPTTPVVAANIAPTITTERANPPFNFPNSFPIVSNRSSAIPERSRITPIKMNRGTASNVKFVRIPQIRRGNNVKKSTPRNMTPNTNAIAPDVNATG